MSPSLVLDIGVVLYWDKQYTEIVATAQCFFGVLTKLPVPVGVQVQVQPSSTAPVTLIAAYTSVSKSQLSYTAEYSVD